MVDYHDFTTKHTPKKERRQKNVGDLWINAVRCNKCGDEPRSTNRHDFQTCKCGAISVDGGSWYIRRSGDIFDYTDLSETFSDVDKDPRDV